MATEMTVRGKCPSCLHSSLFLGAGGYVTCGWVGCAEPTAADSLLHQGAFAWLQDNGAREEALTVTDEMVARALSEWFRPVETLTPSSRHFHERMRAALEAALAGAPVATEVAQDA